MHIIQELFNFTGKAVHLKHGYLLPSRNVSSSSVICGPGKVWRLRSGNLSGWVSVHGGVTPSKGHQVRLVFSFSCEVVVILEMLQFLAQNFQGVINFKSRKDCQVFISISLYEK